MLVQNYNYVDYTADYGADSTTRGKKLCKVIRQIGLSFK